MVRKFEDLPCKTFSVRCSATRNSSLDTRRGIFVFRAEKVFSGQDNSIEGSALYKINYEDTDSDTDHRLG